MIIVRDENFFSVLSSGCSLTGDSNIHVEIGAGDRMLRKALTRVYEMLGKFRDVPDRD